MNNPYYEAFPEKRAVFLPVIHAVTLEQVARNIRIARNNGADGVFLINHEISSYTLIYEIYHRLGKVDESLLKDLWVGMNLLDQNVWRAFDEVPAPTKGLWVDNCRIDDTVNEGAKIAQWRRRRDWDGAYFGSIAFKHQRPVRDPAEIARIAAEFIDVITTSGPGTGMAADPGKIKAMRQAIPNHPFALASGVTLENVEQYLDLGVDCFLVSTGISKNFENLDPKKVAGLAKKIRA